MIKKPLIFRILFLLLILFMTMPLQHCATKSKYTVKVHKPKKRHRPYDHQKNRGERNTKIVKMKN